MEEPRFLSLKEKMVFFETASKTQVKYGRYHSIGTVEKKNFQRQASLPNGASRGRGVCTRVSSSEGRRSSITSVRDTVNPVMFPYRSLCPMEQVSPSHQTPISTPRSSPTPRISPTPCLCQTCDKCKAELKLQDSFNPMKSFRKYGKFSPISELKANFDSSSLSTHSDTSRDKDSGVSSDELSDDDSAEKVHHPADKIQQEHALSVEKVTEYLESQHKSQSDSSIRGHLTPDSQSKVDPISQRVSGYESEDPLLYTGEDSEMVFRSDSELSWPAPPSDLDQLSVDLSLTSTPMVSPCPPAESQSEVESVQAESQSEVESVQAESQSVVELVQAPARTVSLEASKQRHLTSESQSESDTLEVVELSIDLNLSQVEKVELVISSPDEAVRDPLESFVISPVESAAQTEAMLRTTEDEQFARDELACIAEDTLSNEQQSVEDTPSNEEQSIVEDAPSNEEQSIEEDTPSNEQQSIEETPSDEDYVVPQAPVGRRVIMSRWCSLMEEEEEEISMGSPAVIEKVLESSWRDMLEPTPEPQEAPFHSPFEGTISLNMSVKEATSNDNPTLKGFLTIFQEESGLGAWNRRWCSVQDNKIYYWLYPEDEVNRNKEPHGDIDLRDCKTSKISIASRLDCARPNTFVLVTETSTKPGDRNSIICEASNERTVTKYLLSADSKEERREWMKVLNTCLENVISWNTK